MPKEKISSLGELCRWLYGNDEEKVEPLVKSQNPHLRQLNEALTSTRGVSALRHGLPLQQAVNAARGEGAVSTINAAKLFEDICAHAAQVYFGSHDEPANSFVFGFPRRVGPKDFVGAVEELCHRKIREGTPDKKFPGIASNKDAGLDIVTWKPFPDGRSSKLIAFGQCATGANWWEKRHELQPPEWCRTWLLKTPQVYPVKMFFIPHSVSEQEWAALGYQAGIIFDRSRITHFAEKSLPDSLRERVKVWCQTVAANLSQ